MSLLEPRSGRFFAALGFVGVVAVAALVHNVALLQPLPQQDEPSFVEAAELVAAGISPYSQAKYNYPPPLAALGALAIDRGGTGLLLALMRGTNLLAVAALAIYAAGFAGLSQRRRFLLAAAIVALLPIVHYTFWIGNTTPIAGALAIAGWRVGSRSPLGGAALVGVSLAYKPIALAGALYLSARWLGEARRAPRRLVEGLAWFPVAALCVAPWAGELAAMARRMTEPPVFSSRNLSFRRIFDGFGVEVPAVAITLTVLAVALLMARRRPHRPHRPVDEMDREHTAPVVALLALPVAWAHGFLFVLPLQVAAARRYWERRGLRRQQSWQALAERWGVPLGLALIQGSASAGVEFEAPECVRATLILLPMLAPVALLVYLRRSSSPESPVDGTERTPS